MCNEEIRKTADYLGNRAIGLSTKISYCLEKNLVFTFGELKQKSDKELLRIYCMGPKSVDEIHQKLDAFYTVNKEQLCDVIDDTGISVSDVLNGENPRNLSICHMGFSSKAFNCLCRAGYTTLGQVVTLTEDKLMQLPDMNKAIISDIHKTVMEVLSFIKNDSLNDEYKECLRDPYRIYKGKFKYDVPLEELGLSTRSENGLKHLGVQTLSDICWHTEEDLRNMRDIGVKSYNEIMDIVRKKIEELRIE